MIKFVFLVIGDSIVVSVFCWLNRKRVIARETFGLTVVSFFWKSNFNPLVKFVRELPLKILSDLLIRRKRFAL